MEIGNERNENVEGHSDKLENIVQYVPDDPGSDMHYIIPKILTHTEAFIFRYRRWTHDKLIANRECTCMVAAMGIA